MVRLTSRCTILIIITLASGFLGCSRKKNPPAQIDAAAVFNKKCAGCHRNDNEMRAPEPAALREMSRASILAALNSGRMKWQGRFLSKPEKAAIADYLGRPDVSTMASTAAFCARDLDPPANPPVWSGWGADPRNTRFQTTSSAGLDRERVKNLKLKWAFGFPGAAATFGQPTSYAGRLFVGSEDGTVYSLDSATGCLWWMFKAPATVKTAISIGNRGTAAFFGDTNGNVYALKVEDGSVLWQAHPESHTSARITGSPLLIGSRLYVP